jgi:radical SAM-linked protein
MLGKKLRFRFSKTGTLRLLSHHDLMRCLERMLRRAELPFKSTAGFHPTPRVVFALSLPLGVEGYEEVVEVEFKQQVDAADVLARLNSQAPAGLRFLRAAVIPIQSTAIPRRVIYHVPLLPDCVDAAVSICDQLLSQSKVWVDRLRPSPKQLNIRPYLRHVAIDNAVPCLTLDLWVTHTGTARADELLQLLELADRCSDGSVIARTTVELHDEVPNPNPADVPPIGPAETLPLEPATIAALNRRDDDEVTAFAWGATPAGPVVE